LPAEPRERGLVTPRTERAFNRLVVGAVSFGFATLVAVAVLAASVMARNLNFTSLVEHTYQVQSAITDFRNLDERMETARRGYLLSNDERFAADVKTIKAQIDASLQYIQSLTLDNPTQQANVVQLMALVDQQSQAIGVSLAFSRGGADNSSAFYHDTGVATARAIRAQTDHMLSGERTKLAQRDAEQRTSVNHLIEISIAAGLLLIAVGAGSLLVIRRYTRDLSASRGELAVLNAGLEEQVATRTADLRRANDEIQRFAYIVSHDLRSPLVNIMGFTSELEAAAKPLGALLERAEAEAPQIISPDATAAVRSDLPESIGFIRTSTQKMDRLINAILQLSRQGRRVLTPEPLDVSRVLRGVADNLAHRSSELGASIDVAPDLPGVISDRLALEQIFSNLAENALKYLKPGRPGRIEVVGFRQAGRVIYEVRDNGRGIDPKDHDRIFDLFRRAGTQDQPGEGIGLAHVRALAYRLGGTVTCESALDQGATFRVSLPARLGVEGS
jgi:signal transduction histidine kinase